jgi:subtilase family serine protease
MTRKVLLKVVVLCLLLAGASAAWAQSQSRPLMKITVQDGKIMKAVAVDSAGREVIRPEGVTPTTVLPSARLDLQELSRAVPSPKPVGGPEDPARAVARPRTSAEDQELSKSSATFRGDPELLQPRVQPKKGSTEATGPVPSHLTMPPQMKPASPPPADNDKKPQISAAPGTADGTLAWTTIMSQNFEGSFPATGWSCYANSSYTDAYWDDQANRAYAGSWSAWCADEGTQRGTWPTYQANMNAWAVYGPFSLSGSTNARLRFWYWNNSESSFDRFYWAASVDGSTYYGYNVSGNSGGWVSVTYDLGAVPTLGNLNGQSQVYIAFVFQSDGSVQYEGAYIDEVYLEKDVTSLPDLYWTSMPLSTDQWSSGLYVTGSLTEANGGSASAGAHVTQLYLSTNNVISTGDTPLLSTPIAFTSMAAGATQTHSFSFYAPNMAAGTYYVGAIVDLNNQVTESNESNNADYRTGTITYPAGLPDLVWNSMPLSTDQWTPGLSVTGSLTELNQGAGPAGAHNTQLYLSTNNVISTGDTPLLTTPLYYTSMAAGALQTHSFSLIAPSWSPGTYYIGAIVDYTGLVNESDETNNNYTRSGPIYYPSQADLVWTNMPTTPLSDWTPGITVTGSLTESNTGTGSAAAHHTQIYLSDNNVISTGDTPILSSPLAFSSIAAGATQTQSFTTTAPNMSPGTYYIGAIVDVLNEVPETNESNNSNYRVATVTYPTPIDVDLYPYAMSVSSTTWNTGLVVSGTLTEKNGGTTTAGAHNTQLYLSTNTTITTSDVPLLSTTLAYGTIAGGATQALPYSLSAPSEPPGTYYLGIITDVYNSVTETDESNNAGYYGTPITYPAPTPPDLVWTTMPLSTDTWSAGLTVTGSLTEQNIGTGAAGAHVTQLYLSDNSTISTGDTPLLPSPIAFNSIAAGATQTQSFSLTAPAKNPGSYWIGAIVDLNNQVTESDESNNAVARNGQITYPTPNILDIPFAVTDNAGGSATVHIGLSPSATDGIDNALGEIELPPTPPSGVFDVRLVGDDISIALGQGSMRDYRYSTLPPTSLTKIHELKYQVGTGTSITIAWNFPSNTSGLLQDMVTGSLISVSMSGSSSYTISNPGSYPKMKMTIYYGGVPPSNVTVASGWNMLSVPLQAADMTPTSLFPGALTPAYGYSGGYVNSSPLMVSKGYWMKFASQQTFTISGSSVTPRDVAVAIGWNMIGPYNVDAATASITTTPSGIIQTSFYGYSGGYSTASSLTVGKGYWVKCSSAGTLHLQPNSSPPPVGKEAEDVTASWVRIDMTDGVGMSGRLYLSDQMDAGCYELPPLPPSGIFDVRFGDNSFVQGLSAGREILVASAVYPLRVTVSNLQGRVLRLRDGGTGTNVPVEEGKPVVLANQINSFTIEQAAPELPTAYALNQNFPNPFNPSTMISFALPVAGHVKISVFNVLGQKLAELVNGDFEAGIHQVQFSGESLASGIYLYRMEAGSFVAVKKLLLMK